GTEESMTELYRFGPFELDLARGDLLEIVSGESSPIHIPPQPLRALEHLVREAGNLVTRDELSEAIWPQGIHVDQEIGLNHCIRRLRGILGDEAQRPRYIQTVPKRGYRFIARIERTVQLRENEGNDQLLPEGSNYTKPGRRIAVQPFSVLSTELADNRLGDRLAEEITYTVFKKTTHLADCALLSQYVGATSVTLGAEFTAPATIEAPDLIIAGSVRSEEGYLRVLGYLIRTSDRAILRTAAWLNQAIGADLGTQQIAAEALVDELLEGLIPSTGS
ncbi:Cholera toxin transcriptional activator, partial [Exaiptasia diaphana]